MSTFRPSHRALFLCTALASGIVAAMPAPALAQAIPTAPVVQKGTPDISTVASAMTIDLKGASAVINWTSFDVQGLGSLTIQSKSAPATFDTTPVSLLNRVTGATASTITNPIHASNNNNHNISVWLVNPNGITWGNGATYNGGSLVLSTLDIADDNQFIAGHAMDFATTDATPGGSIAINSDLSSPGDLIILAKNVTLGNGGSGDSISAGGNLVVVAANSVQFGDIGSPLSFTVGEGAAFTPAASVGVEVLGSASVSGQNVTVAAVSKSAALANILKVDNGASLTATKSGGGVVTLATNSVGTVAVAAAAVNSFDSLDFDTGAAVKADGSAGQINLVAAGNLAFDGDIDSSTDGALLAKGAKIALDTGTVAYGSQTYDGPVTLGANTTITGAGTFKGTLDGSAGGTSLSVSGAAEFDGVVGGVAKLSSLTASSTAAINGAAIRTTGGQTYDGAVTLGGGPGVTLLSDTGQITFSGTVDSVDATARNLTVDGLLTVAGNVGSTNHLNNFEAKKATRIDAASIASDNSQTYDDAVVLGGNTSLTGSTVKFLSTVDSVNSTARDLAITGNARFDQDVGATKQLKTISVSGNSTLNAAQYKTSGNQTFGLTSGTSDSLGADATFTTATGTVAFGGSLNGAHSLLVTGASGDARFGGQVGNATALTSVQVDGTTALDGGLVKTTGNQTYNGAATVGANLTLTGPTATFNSTVDSSGGAHTLITNTASAVFNDAVGGSSALAAYQAIGDVTLGTNTVKTTGDQIYAGANLNLTTNTTLTSTGGTVELLASVNNPTSLALTIAGDVAVDGSLGGVTPLGSFHVSGATGFGGAAAYVKTTGDQTYDGPVSLANDIALTTTLGGTIAFGSTVDSFGAAHSLTLDSGLVNGLDASFGGAVGGTLPLSNLTINNANSITATGNITTNNTLALDAVGPISVAGLTSNSGNIRINQVSPTPGAVSVSGPVSTAGDYMLKATSVSLGGSQSAPGKIEITATTGDITGGPTLNMRSNSSNGAVTNWLYLDAGNGTITLDPASQLGTGTANLGIRVSGGANVALGTVNAASLGEIDAGHTFTAGLTPAAINDLTATAINLNTPISIDVAGNLVLGQVATPANATLAGSSVSLGGAGISSFAQGFDVTANAGAITLAGTINSPAFNQTYHGPVTLASQTDLNAATATFTSTLDGPAGLAVTGNASFDGAVGGTIPLASLLVTGTASLAAPTVHTVGDQTFSSAVVLTADTNLVSDTGLIAFASTLDSDATPRALDISGNALFSGAVGAGSALDRLTVSGTTVLDGGFVSTVNNQTYTGAVTLGADTTLNAGGTVNFGSAVANDGTPRSLIANAATTTFGGPVGSGGSALTSLLVNGASVISGGSIFAADQTYNGGVTLGADAALTGTTITFLGTVDGPHALVANASTTFAGAVTIASLTVNGPAFLNGGSVTTTGQQSYQGAVTLGSDNVLTGSLVDFASTVDGAYGLTITGDADFGDAVGLVTPLTSLTVSGSSIIAGPSITTTGVQTFNGSVQLDGNTALTGSAVTFNSTLDSLTATARDLVINGAATFNQAVGGTNALGTLTTNNQAAINGGSVTTTVAQNYNGATTVGADTTLTSLQVLFASALDSSGAARDLTIMGDATFDAAAGATLALDSLHVTGKALFNGSSITTVGAQAYDGPATLGTDLSLTGSAITFGSTLDGAHALSITGDAAFNGPVGSTSAPTQLTVTAPGAISAGSTITVAGPIALTGDSINLTGLLKSTGGTGSIALTSTAATTLSDVDASAGLTVNAGTLSVANTAKAAGAINLTVAGAATLGSIDGNAGVTVGADSLTVNGAAKAADTLDITTTGATHLGSATSGGALTIHGGSITVDGLTATLNAGSPIALTSTGATTLDGVDSAGSLTVNAGTIDVTNTAKAAGAIDLTVGGAATLGAIDGGTGVTVGAGSLSVSGAAKAATMLDVTTTGATHLGSASSGGAMTIQGDTIKVDGLAATLNPGRAMLLKSTGATTLDAVDSSGALTVNAGTLSVAHTAKAAGAMNLTVGGAATLADIDGQAGVTVGAGSLTVSGAAKAVGTLDVTTTGATQLGSASSGGALTIHGGSIKVDGLTTTLNPGSAIALTSTGATTLDSVDSAGSLSVNAGTLTVTDTAKAAGATNLTVGGAATLGAIDGGAGVTVGADSLTVSGAANAAGTLDITTAGATHLGSATSGGAMTIHGGSIIVDGLAKTTGATGAIALTSTGATTLDGLDSSAGLTVNADTLNVANTAKAAGAIGLTVAGAAQLGAIDGGAGVTVTAGSLTVTGAANSAGALNVTTTDATHLGSASAGGAMTVHGGSITVDGLTRTSNAGSTIALTSTGATTLDTIDSSAGLTVDAGTLDVAQTAKAAGAIALNVGGATQLGAIDGGAGVSVNAGSLTVTGSADAAGTLDVTTTGETHLGSATTGGAMTIHGGSIKVDGLTRTTGATGAIALTSTGATTLDGVDSSAGLTVNANTLDVAHTAKAAGPIALTVAGAAQLGAIDGGAGVTVNAGSLTVTGAANAAGALDVTTTGATHLGSAAAGGAMTVSGSSVTVDGLAKSGAAMTLTATDTALDVGSIEAGGDVALSAKTKATLGSVTASGHAIKLTAADADLKANLTASSVTIVDKASGDHDLNLGDGAGSGGFDLSAAEINRIAAPTLVLDAGTGTGLTRQNISIGSLSLTNPVLKDLAITGLQRIDMTGGLKGTTLTKLQIGGTGTPADVASVLRIAAKPDGTGGLIDVGAASLVLHAATIGIGQDTGFLKVLGVTEGSTASQTAEYMVSNANSSLYNPVVGGGAVYTAAGQHLIVAGKLSVRYTNFALIQNTATIGGNEGVVLASAATPATPALEVSGPNPPDGGPFALFGNINGKIGNEAAILGPTEINLVAVDRATARINGCVVGSGSSCLNSSALATTFTNFTPARTTIIFVSPDLESPFDPLIATNNDSLFGDVGTVGLGDIAEPPIECEATPGQPCPTPKEGAK